MNKVLIKQVLAFILMMGCLGAMAQTNSITVTGIIIDGSGVTIPGVNVLEKANPTNGVITGIDGSYTINVSDKDAILSFSFIGYKEQQIAIDGRTEINVSLIEELTGLDEVVVIGYGTNKKGNLTGAISTVDTEQLTVSSEPTMSGALVGKIAGVSTRQSNGKPGAGTNLQIRNLGTPLYIIDGIQKDAGQFNNLDATDIETITVLKDASAAIYGMKASNGVVVVTTKKGKLNTKNTINASYRIGWQNFTQFPDMMNAAQWVDHMVERDMNLYGETSWTKDEYSKWQNGTEPGYEGFNWKKSIIRENAPQRHMNVNASGGSDKIAYYFSYSTTDQKGMFDGYGFKRNNIQSNIEAELAHGLKVSMNINGRIEKRDGIMTTLHNWDNFYIFSEAMFRNRPTERPFANDNPLYPADNGNRSYVNTAAITKNNSGSWDDTWRVLQGNMELNYKTPIKGLSAKLLASYYYADQKYEGQKFNYDLYSYNKENDEYLVTGGSPGKFKRSRFNSVEENVYRAQLNYVRKFNKHSLNAVIAGEMSERKTPGFSIDGTPTTNELSLMKSSEFNSLWNGYGESARAGVIGRVNYVYDDKFIVELSGRYDGTYKFANGNRWGFFPAMALAYRVSQEKFWSNLGIDEVVDDFKIRSSYGKMGDDGNVGGFEFYDGYSFDRGKYVMGSNNVVIGVEQRGLPATNISWIETTNFNIGFDVALLDQKIFLSADFFTRKREGLLAYKNDVVIPSEVGFNLPKDNLESDMNIGWDASLTYRDKTGDLSYEIGANVGFSRRKTVDRYNPQFATSLHEYWNKSEDRWQGTRWGYKSDGQFQSQEQIDNWQIDNDGRGNRSLRPGDIIYKDLNGDGKIDWYDRRPIGYSNGMPLVNYGISVGLNWKGFDLYMLWQGAGKYNYYRDWEVQKPAPGDGNSPAFLADRWHREDPFDVNSDWIPGKYPSTGSWHPWNNNNYDKSSDFWLHNINYIRLKNIELGYNVPSLYLKKIGLQSLRVYVSGTNLLTFDNIDIVDPEITSSNAVTYPPVKTYNLGFKLTL